MNIGIRGGEFVDTGIINQAIDIMNFHIKGNMVLNTAALNSDNTDYTKNEFSFYQQRNRLMLIGMYLSGSATPPGVGFNPTIYSAVDRTNTSVIANYTGATKTTETITIKINNVDYYLHFLKTEYTVTHTGDVWIVADVAGAANKDFLSTVFQFAAIQYENSVTLINEIVERQQADYTDWNAIQAFLNNSDTISYSTQVFDYQGNTQRGASPLFMKTYDPYDLETGNFDAYVKLNPFTNPGNFIAFENNRPIVPGFSGTAYTKGYLFNMAVDRQTAKNMLYWNTLNLDMYGVSPSSWASSRLYQLQHVNFQQKRYSVTTISSQDALSSHNLFQLSRTVLTRFIGSCYDGAINLGQGFTSLLLEGKPAVFGLKLMFGRESNADYYMTLGNGERYYFDFTTRL